MGLGGWFLGSEGTPDTGPKPSHAPSSPTTSPGSWPAFYDPPDPCTLIDPAKVDELRQLAEVKPKKKDVVTVPGTCTWELDRPGGTTSVIVKINDLRTRTTQQIPGAPPWATMKCAGTVLRADGGQYCQGTDRRSFLSVSRRNLYAWVMWADTAVSRTRPDGRRVAVENRVNRQLADQLLARLPG
ncbi:DUF3558 domain-containing protein [Actinomadura rayongensis]|uniref:DUF3558 domain-containing protein n=1 Tax=Actinomadura rayongensis TaxID=1429076 RepID=A0A6I4VZ04_9ACTN|nr:DUF3558 domain-containing protein [Actinomadura rayongensis]MXQ63207.1 hypothetical protein [Actinomadura rayongensis]